MKFGQTLRQQIIKEWAFYAVDYKAMKKTLNAQGIIDGKVDHAEFDRLFELSQKKLRKFYEDKESWAKDYIHVLEERVEALRESHTASMTEAFPENSSPENETDSENEESSTHSPTSTGSPTCPKELEIQVTRGPRPEKRTSSSRKEAYRRMGRSAHFQNFIYAKKSLATFDRELSLILEFLNLNKTAFSKILKKSDKLCGTANRARRMEETQNLLPFLKGTSITSMKEQVEDMIAEVNEIKPKLPDGWGGRKVYTIGCFDLFHRGHQNVLLSLREFGHYIVAGIHDDQSYYKLKKKYPIDNLETRMRNVKPLVDQLYVIPSTDPLLYIQSVVSTQDIEAGSCCYARGDDMLQFPGREWVESVMPVHFVPRTESCSSTLLRTIYHADDEELRIKAAFAKTRYDGKPVDEDGNVLKLTQSCPALAGN